MRTDTRPVFVIGSGRSGSRALYKALLGFSSVEAHHEYCCTHVQPLAAKFFMKRASFNQAKTLLASLHGAAIELSAKSIWVDSSNKLTWVVGPLIDLFPNARFVNLVRDGRKVVISWVRKLGDEIYDDVSVKILRDWLDHGSSVEPPPEKKYWWNVPQPGQPFHELFPSFNQLERASYHWVESNRVARETLQSSVPKDQQITLRLEDLVGSSEVQQDLLAFLELDWTDSFGRALSTPQHVIVPIDYRMNESELQAFAKIASTEMANLGYDINVPEYRVSY